MLKFLDPLESPPYASGKFNIGLHADRHASHMHAATGKIAILLLQSTYALHGSAWRQTSTEYKFEKSFI